MDSQLIQEMKLLTQSFLVFWDFDGVIKETVNIKEQAFVKLFLPFGQEVTQKVSKHHESNGGMSRFDKFPIYLRWAGIEPQQENVRRYCERFSQLTFNEVINAPWVPGVEDYLRSNHYRQTFVLVSATPQEELLQILNILGLHSCFSFVIGSPIHKKDAIRSILNNLFINPLNCLMIGDARVDLEAAEYNHVPFLLRKHYDNSKVFADYKGLSFNDFTEV